MPAAPMLDFPVGMPAACNLQFALLNCHKVVTLNVLMEQSQDGSVLTGHHKNGASINSMELMSLNTIEANTSAQHNVL